MTVPQTAPGVRRTARGRLAKAALALSLALATLPGATAVAWSAPAHAALAPAAVLQPPLPVDAFPEQVARACAIWGDLGWPTNAQPVDYRIPDGDYIRGSNPYGNRSGDLPHGGAYHEYDVNPRPTPTTHRDAERLVRDENTAQVWYSGDHYANFREIDGGC
ncbi:ribonuclease domain-containing protein [Kitasatospora sp. NPDC056446]|uniref:ribonuclease domain-containing protein n=1 Tax=Kitasatospora sp. NPDC056446 TaxID=3345819 RepID=UPI0036A7848F